MRTRIMLAVACGVLACSGGDGIPDAAHDAGHDAALLDAPDDGDSAASDVGTDADAALDPSDPGWERISGFPIECAVERARQPEAVLAFHWEACADGVTDCMMTVVDRSCAPFDRPLVLNGGNDLRGVMAFHLQGAGASYTVLSREDRVVAAWRAPEGVVDEVACLADPVASSTGIALDAGFLRGDGTGTAFISVADWSRLGALEDSVWPSNSLVTNAGDFLQTPSTSGTTFAGTLLSGRVLAVEPPNAEILGRGDLGPVVVGHTVLWNWFDGAGATGIHASRIGGAEVELYRAPAGSAVYGVRSDGQWITWRAQADGATPPFHELWVAPYATTGTLVARHLWDDVGVGGHDGTIGDGMYAYAGPSSAGLARIAVVDLTDGSRREAILPPTTAEGDGWHIVSDPAWVTHSEVAFPATYVAGTSRMQTVVRVDIRALTVEPLRVGGSDAGM